MSDLIERLETLRRLSREDSLTVVQQNSYSDHLDDIMAANFDEIITALKDQKTVRGIEGLAKNGMEEMVCIAAPINDPLAPSDSQWYVEIKYERHFGDTLPLAVDAAVAGMKGE